MLRTICALRRASSLLRQPIRPSLPDHQRFTQSVSGLQSSCKHLIVCSGSSLPPRAYSAASEPSMGRKRKEVEPTPERAEAKPDGQEEPSEPKPKKAGRKKKEPEPEREFYSEEMRPARIKDGLTLLCWNVNSLNSLLKRDQEKGSDQHSLLALADAEQADVICLQETKLQSKKCDGLLQSQLGLSKWKAYWVCNEAPGTLGRAGLATFCRSKPLSVKRGLGISKHDGEGRVLTVELADFWLVNVYVPNSGQGLKRIDYRIKEWDLDFAAFVAKLGKTKPVIVAGDFNCAPEELDIARPKTNLKSAGFTPEERQSFADNLIGSGLVDVWRQQYPGKAGYTYWDMVTRARERNTGWRIDMFLVAEALTAKVHSAFQLPSIMGSDHCPIGLTLELTSPQLLGKDEPAASDEKDPQPSP